VADWLPLLEDVQRAYESLLVATDAIDPVVRQTLVINNRKETLRCCAVRASSARDGADASSGGITTATPYGVSLPHAPGNSGGAGRRDGKGPWKSGLAGTLGMGGQGPPMKRDRLPLASEVLIRRSAAVVFPSSDEWRSSLEEIAVVEVGGDYYEDQQARLRFANEWLRQEDKRGR
jgi:hypothetical protein